MDLHGKTQEEVIAALSRQSIAFRCLSARDQSQVAAMAITMAARGLPLEFVLSSVRATARLMVEAEAEQSDPQRPLPEFVRVSVLPPSERVSPRTQPRREAKAMERDWLLRNTRQILREARAAKQPHERKKMRRRLMAIDQAHIRRVLGQDAQQLCSEINEYLRGCSDLR
jgi:hypothetical protein